MAQPLAWSGGSLCVAYARASMPRVPRGPRRPPRHAWHRLVWPSLAAPAATILLAIMAAQALAMGVAGEAVGASFNVRNARMNIPETAGARISRVVLAGGGHDITPPYSKVTYDDKSCNKGLYKLFYAPSDDLLLLFFSSTKGFSMLIKCRRDIAPQCAHYKRQSRGRIWMILTDSWLNLGPVWTPCAS